MKVKSSKPIYSKKKNLEYSVLMIVIANQASVAIIIYTINFLLMSKYTRMIILSLTFKNRNQENIERDRQFITYNFYICSLLCYLLYIKYIFIYDEK